MTNPENNRLADLCIGRLERITAIRRRRAEIARLERANAKDLAEIDVIEAEIAAMEADEVAELEAAERPEPVRA